MMPTQKEPPLKPSGSVKITNSMELISILSLSIKIDILTIFEYLILFLKPPVKIDSSALLALELVSNYIKSSSWLQLKRSICFHKL